MADENLPATADLDLFGAPVTQIRERWGRPSFAKSKENQELVALLKAAGWRQAKIAAYLGCDEKTLRKYFSRELEHGDYLIEGMALEVTLKKMRSGNSVATGRILDLVDRGRAAVPFDAGARPAQDADEPERLGKKEIANRDAQTAHEGTGWGALLPN